MRIFEMSEQRRREIVLKSFWLISMFMLALGVVMIILFWD